MFFSTNILFRDPLPTGQVAPLNLQTKTKLPAIFLHNPASHMSNGISMVPNIHNIG